jgi:phage-related protein
LATVRFQEAIYVLHAFQKKSKKGIATPKKDIDLRQATGAQRENHFRRHGYRAALCALLPSLTFR